MSELAEQLHPVTPLCECGKPLTHVGMCSKRIEKALQTRANNRATKLQQLKPVTEPPSISFFHVIAEGDHVRLQITGATRVQLKEALLTLGRTLDLSITISD